MVNILRKKTGPCLPTTCYSWQAHAYANDRFLSILVYGNDIFKTYFLWVLSSNLGDVEEGEVDYEDREEAPLKMRK